jgi:2-polyprenyl-6-methoxyphenol hydroxylase-like FAD-dependent oxidoreductase
MKKPVSAPAKKPAAATRAKKPATAVTRTKKAAVTPAAAAPQVLIAGAGPTGLVLALWLTRMGVTVRLIDKALEPGTTSRALAVQARTLELYRQMGLADEVVKAGYEFDAINFWVAGEKAVHAELGAIGEGQTPFPYLLIFPQDRHERFLIEHLKALGVEVERGVELLGFEDDGTRVIAHLSGPEDAMRSCEVAYLAGCDGAHSNVRRGLDVGFPGGAYAQLFYVADAQASGPVADGQLHVALDAVDFLAAFPMDGKGRVRLIGAIRPESVGRKDSLTWDDVSRRVLDRLKVTVDKVNWFSTYHVHHRVASHFRRGRAFILGDAAHIHSPVGGQGMNTGIGDAINLAWKLAAVLGGSADERLLDSYEPERIAFARRLVATTDRVFTIASSPSPLAEFLRMNLLPRLAPAAFGVEAMRKFLFRTVSQTGVNYRGSRLSVGGAGFVRGGDRLPWVQPETRAEPDNFAPLNGQDWQVHVYGVARAGLEEACDRRRLALHVFPWRYAMHKAGMMQNAAYLVRPDGYVALADPNAAAGNLDRYFDARGLQP